MATMAGPGQRFTIAYRSIVAGDLARPILVMQVTGINGRSGMVPGIVDSGADTSSFPFDYAQLMGYGTTTLVTETFEQAGGSGNGYRALRARTAVVPEIPGTVVSMTPSFIPGSGVVLWGRTDFMMAFDVTVSESNQQFTITALR